MWFVLPHIYPLAQYDVYSQEPQLLVEPLAGECPGRGGLLPVAPPSLTRGRVEGASPHRPPSGALSPCPSLRDVQGSVLEVVAGRSWWLLLSE